MRIRISHHIACAGVNLPVGTVRVHPLHLWSAMHIDDKRILLRRVEVVGFHNEHLYRVALGALHPHSLAGANVYGLLERIVVMGYLSFLATVKLINGSGLAGGAVSVNKTAMAVGIEAANGLAGNELGYLVRLYIDAEQRLHAALFAQEVNAF